MNHIRLFVCGDIVNQNPCDGFIGEDLSNVIKESDYAVCNFEGPELSPGQSALCPHQEPGTANYLKSIGFDLMLLANNHITELGKEGVQHSISCIKEVGADYIGAGTSWNEAYKPLVKTIKDVNFGFINVCEAQVGQFLSPSQGYGYAWMGYDRLLMDVTELSKKNKYVVVFVHSGLEHYSLPLPELRDLYHKICDAGASVVIGGHPHVPQGWEYYNDNLIVYSLGNFYFPYKDNYYPNENISYSVRVDFIDGEKIKITPIHHKLASGKVNMIEDPRQCINTDMLCRMLESNYENKATDMCVNAYKKLCSSLLSEATCGQSYDMSYFQQIKGALRYILFRKRLVEKTRVRRNALLLRLFENETYRWTIIRALKNI